jgi:hypothetical protein
MQLTAQRQPTLLPTEPVGVEVRLPYSHVGVIGPILKRDQLSGW